MEIELNDGNRDRANVNRISIQNSLHKSLSIDEKNQNALF